MKPQESSFSSAVAAVASAIDRAGDAQQGGSFLSRGDIAALRRLDYAVPPSAFWRLMASLVPEELRRGAERERRWAIVCQGVAIMSPHAHDASVTPGAALASAGFASDDRPMKLNRLLSSDDGAFDGLAISCCRFLSSKAVAFDWRKFAAFIVFRDEESRRRLARDFFSASARPQA